MTLKEIRKQKMELGLKILPFIITFEKKTGTTVLSLHPEGPRRSNVDPSSEHTIKINIDPYL